MSIFNRDSEEWKQKEARRCRNLDEYEIIGAETPELNSLTKILALICKTPIAAISIIDRNNFYVKSSIGISFERGDRHGTICDWTIEQEEVLEVKNSHQDERFKNNPNV